MSDNFIIYDGDCIFCKNYIKFSNFLNEYQIELINARLVKDPNKIELMKKYKIDTGMILHFENNYYTGSEAMTKITTINDNKKYFNKTLNFFFKSKKISNLLYPYFVIIRNLTLKIRGISKIFN